MGERGFWCLRLGEVLMSGKLCIYRCFLVEVKSISKTEEET